MVDFYCCCSPLLILLSSAHFPGPVIITEIDAARMSKINSYPPWPIKNPLPDMNGEKRHNGYDGENFGRISSEKTKYKSDTTQKFGGNKNYRENSGDGETE